MYPLRPKPKNAPRVPAPEELEHLVPCYLAKQKAYLEGRDFDRIREIVKTVPSYELCAPVGSLFNKGETDE